MREDIGRWLCFFMLSYIVLVFWLMFFNAFHLISALNCVSCCYHRGEKWLVNSITFFLLCGGSVAERMQQWQHDGCDQLNSIGDILVECDFRNCRGMTLRRQQRKRAFFAALYLINFLSCLNFFLHQCRSIDFFYEDQVTVNKESYC